MPVLPTFTIQTFTISIKPYSNHIVYLIIFFAFSSSPPAASKASSNVMNDFVYSR